MNLLDSSGKPVQLGDRVGGGGEGSVYKVEGKPNLAAKIYKVPASKTKVRKLEAMIRLGNDQLVSFTTWPLDILRDASSREYHGFVMPLVMSGKEIHKLYGPKSRMAEFRKVDWRFLIHAASNVARAFATIHNSDLVIGDVNHSSVMVAQDATVKLIDCDSFQVTSGREKFLCEVGELQHTPPELQGSISGNIVRLATHDNFGLAVLIFELLFMGRHPFAGEFLGSSDLSLDQKIAGHRFAYGPGAASRQMKQPPGTLELSAVSDPVASLFERAFSKEASLGQPRPTAGEWVSQLTDLLRKLVQCRKDAAHYYLVGLPRCPWCDIEAQSGVRLFHFAGAAAHEPGLRFDLELVWEAIQRVSAPGGLPELLPNALPNASASPACTELGIKQRRAAKDAAALLTPTRDAMKLIQVRNLLLAFILVTAIQCARVYGYKPLPVGGLLEVGAILGFLSSATSYRHLKARLAKALSLDQELQNQVWTIRHKLEAQMSAIQSKLYAIQSRWNSFECSDASFTDEHTQLLMAKHEFELLPALRRTELNRLKDRARELQLDHYLDTCQITSLFIPNIGFGRVITLRAYGIETAADVKRMGTGRIPGINPSLRAELLAWQARMEASFVFNPNAAVDPNDVQEVDAMIQRKRYELEARLTAGASALRRHAQEIASCRQSTHAEYVQAQHQLAQIQADLAAI